MAEAGRGVLSVALLLGVAACAPPLARPDTDVAVKAYLPAPLDKTVFSAGNMPAAWWKQFHNATLDALVAQALRDNPGLGQAAAEVSVAAQNGDAATGAYLPQIGLNPNVTRQAYPTGPNGSPPYTIYSLVGSISYDPGIFGARHYSFANAQAQIAYQQAELDAARQTLVGNIAAAFIAAASFQGQIAATKNIIAREQNLLTLLNGEFADGAIPKLNVLQQQAQILATQATLYPLQTEVDAQRDRLAVLTGQLPAQLQINMPALDELTVPPDVPVTLPSAYLAGRPDLRAARALVAAQNAQLGIAVAHFYPDITLTADGGYAAEALNALFEPSAGLWSLAANMLQPLYDGGVLHARKKAAQAELAAALFAYHAAVLNAFGEAADTLQALQNDQAALAHAQDSASTAAQGYQLARQQFALGAVDYTTVLTAQITAGQQALVLVQTQAGLLLDIARLQSAMAQ
jgi:NodT family efflux transporter outer membrane factor (OMF) lipoprotein